ncbi:MAG: branched-chain amino acid ABC transporter substrate-binding protein [Deltaproteobacteria bacterium]|jgi:branched-chain amino acid transport system substrate-binding protein|nr:branched-chain amino acid ABC transporter substrate-binding protein [Deltaproteobacteria bacterium]
MRAFFFFLSLLTMVASLAVFAPGPAQAADPIRIGLMAPTTGPWANEGQDMVKVVEILVNKVNSSGGINGSMIALEIGDDGGTPKTATLAAQRLVTRGVVAVVGTYGSAVTEASQDIYDEAGVVQIATGSTSIRLSEKGLKLFFRTCPRDDEQGRVLAQKVKELGFKKPAIIHDNTSYAKGLAEEVQAMFSSLGLVVAYFDTITPGERDFAVALSKIKAQNPDIIVFTGYYPEASTLLRQKREMGWDVAIIGGDATNNRALVELAGPAAAAGYYFVSPPGPGDMKSPVAKEFFKVYLEKHKQLPSSVWSVLAGDAFNVIVEAIAKVGPDSTKIANYLHHGLEDYQGLSGTISFNEKGDRIGEVYRLYRVDEKGDFILRD